MGIDLPRQAKTYYLGKYRNKSARCAPWDYTSRGAYFITICTHDRIDWFGKIRNRIMCLSNIGSIVADEWMKTPILRSYVSLDEWIIMPDHLHGIIMIRERTNMQRIDDRNPHHCRNWQPGSLGVVIQQIKRASTERIHRAGYPGFAWQPRYHDHIIRHADDLDRIRLYIRMNPRRWGRAMGS